jgi:hypothetical protein
MIVALPWHDLLRKTACHDLARSRAKRSQKGLIGLGAVVKCREGFTVDIYGDFFGRESDLGGEGCGDSQAEDK